METIVFKRRQRGETRGSKEEKPYPMKRKDVLRCQHESTYLLHIPLYPYSNVSILCHQKEIEILATALTT
jgi:hypothetical protein